MKEFFIKFCETNWQIVFLFMLLLLLFASHAYMIHYGRPPQVISWAESMITATFTAIIAKLK